MPEQTNLFESIFESSLDGVLLSRPDGTILRANPAACRALGRSEDELRRTGREGLVLEDASLRQLLAQRQTLGAVAGELTFCRPDGSSFPADFTSGLIPSGEGAPLSYVIFRDISDRRQREEVRRRDQDALRQSDAMLKGLLDAIPDYLFLKDRAGRWTFANSATLKVVGKPMDQVLGKTDSEIYSLPAIGKALAEVDRRIMESGTAEVLEETLQTPDGLRVFLSTKAPFRDHEGRVVGLIGVAQDTTERRRVEDELRQRDQLLSLSQQAAHVGTWNWKIGAPNVEWSDETYRIYGLSPEMGPPLFEFYFQIIHPDDRPLMRAWGEVCAAGGHPPPVEFRVVRPDGSIRVVETAGDVIETVDGVASRIAGTAHDVTQSALEKRALRDSEDRFRKVFDRSLIGIAVSRVTDGRFLDVNASFLSWLGYEKEDVVGKTSAELGLWLDPGAQERMAQSMTSGGPAQEIEARFKTKDGAERIGVMSSAFITLNGEPNVLSVVRDITESRLAEAERERLMKALEQTAESVVITDTRGAIVYVNPALEAVTGFTRTEVLGQNARIFKSGEHDEAFYEALWKTITGGHVWRSRMINQKKDGSHFTEDVSISPVRDESGISSFVAVKRDVTHDLALEAQVTQSQKMASIGRLAGGVAHDFNNLLTVILSCAKFALEDLREGDSVRDDLQEIERAGMRAASLTRQLLAFSRKQVMQPVPLELNRTLAEMEKMLRRILGEDIDLVQVLAPDLGIVKADPGQVEQVIMNLAVNARDAMPDGGKLTIETANVEIDEHYAAQHAEARQGPHVMIAVSDSGTGMDEQTMAHVFEPFFTTKKPGSGTGLGLSTVDGIVKQSGGNISVYSELGKGTTFKVYLPRELSLAAVAKKTEPVLQPGGVETILVVEDDEAVRNIARRILAGAGYTVLTGANGAEGLLICEQHQAEIHLVLTDVVMPLMSGRIFAEKLAKLRPRTKVLFMSGFTDNAIVHHGVLDEGTQFISKPLDKGELLRKVRAVLGPSD